MRGEFLKNKLVLVKLSQVIVNLQAFLLSIMWKLDTQLKIKILPSFASDRINVSVSLRSETPEDVEKSISIRIEEPIQGLEGIKQISSRSSEGSSAVNIEVESSYDAREVLADIKSRVDSINTFPAEDEKPVVFLATLKREVISVSVASIYGEKATREYAEKVRDELLKVPSITQAELSGVRNYEIYIEIPQDKLQQYNLTIAQVSAAINNASTDVSARCKTNTSHYY